MLNNLWVDFLCFLLCSIDSISVLSFMRILNALNSLEKNKLASVNSLTVGCDSFFLSHSNLVGIDGRL